MHRSTTSDVAQPEYGHTTGDTVEDPKPVWYLHLRSEPRLIAISKGVDIVYRSIPSPYCFSSGQSEDQPRQSCLLIRYIYIVFRYVGVTLQINRWVGTKPQVCETMPVCFQESEHGAAKRRTKLGVEPAFALLSSCARKSALSARGRSYLARDIKPANAVCRGNWEHSTENKPLCLSSGLSQSWSVAASAEQSNWSYARALDNSNVATPTQFDNSLGLHAPDFVPVDVPPRVSTVITINLLRLKLR